MPSYSDCAARIVRLAPKPSLRDASCCRVLVVNGGGADLRRSERVTLWTLNRSPLSAASCCWASASEPMRALAPSMRLSSAVNVAPPPARRSSAASVQYSSLTKAPISRRSEERRVGKGGGLGG